MKLIFENWREYLSEEAKHPIENTSIQEQLNNLLKYPKAGIIISLDDPTDEVVTYRFEYAEINNLKEKKFKRLVMRPSHHVPIFGQILISKNDKDQGPCFNGWVIVSTGTLKGMGPLLYEVALEWSSENGVGLMSDRGVVSGEAIAVWNKYATRAKAEPAIDMKQMDVVHGIVGRGYMDDIKQLTPNYYFDDCDQKKAIVLGKETDWHKKSISKIYSKDIPEVLRVLEAEGRLIILT